MYLIETCGNRETEKKDEKNKIIIFMSCIIYIYIYYLI